MTILTNEELVLLIRHCDNRKEYFEALYNQNYGLIRDTAKRYAGVYDLEDLMQESYIGLVDAVESFDSEAGYKFASFMTVCIRYHLLNYLRDHGYSVRLPAHLQEKTRKLNKVIEDFYKNNAHKPSNTELAKILNMTPEQVEQLLSAAQLLKIKSLNVKISDEDDTTELSDTVPDPVNQYEDAEDRIQHEQLKEVLWGIVDGLEPIQAEVIKNRYQEGLTLVETAERLNVSKDKVRSTEDKAFRKLRLSKNRCKLQPFLSDEKIYSLSLQFGGYHRYINTWTSAPEKAVLLAERLQG